MKIPVTITGIGDATYSRDVECHGQAAVELQSLMDQHNGAIPELLFGCWVNDWSDSLLLCDRPLTNIEMVACRRWIEESGRRLIERDGCCGRRSPYSEQCPIPCIGRCVRLVREEQAALIAAELGDLTTEEVLAMMPPVSLSDFTDEDPYFGE